MEDLLGDDDGIQVVSQQIDNTKYAAPEVVTEDKQGRPQGSVYSIKQDGGVLSDKLSQEALDRAKVQSQASLRIYTTYTNNDLPVDSPQHSYVFAGTGTLMCKAPQSKDMATARLLTNDHVASNVMPKVDNLSDEQRRKYVMKSISADPNVRAGVNYDDEHWRCEKLNSMVDNLKLLQKATPSLDADFCFLKCSGPKDSVDNKTVMVPTLPSTQQKHQQAQGVGYPGQQPLVHHENMFKGRGDRQTLVQGNVKTGSSTDVLHEVPTKPGMSGTTFAESGTPNNSFQYLHSRSVANSYHVYNGAVSTNNPAFISQYDTHIVQAMPSDLPEKAQAIDFVKEAQAAQHKQINSWFSGLWR